MCAVVLCAVCDGLRWVGTIEESVDVVLGVLEIAFELQTLIGGLRIGPAQFGVDRVLLRLQRVPGVALVLQHLVGLLQSALQRALHSLEPRLSYKPRDSSGQWSTTSRFDTKEE